MRSHASPTRSRVWSPCPVLLALLTPALVAGALLLACDPVPRPFLLWGQSNNEGRSTQATPVAPGRVFRARTFDWFGAISDPEVHAKDKEPWGSAWPSFAAEMLQATGEEVVLVGASKGGTCLLDWPDEGIEGRWDPETGDLYERGVESWLATGLDTPRAVLWLQGECDAGAAHRSGWTAAETRAAYAAALVDLADAIHGDVGAPLVAAPISLMLCDWDNETCDPAQFRSPNPVRQPVHDATLDAIAASPYILPGPETSDLRSNEGDRGHIWDVNELGRRWAAVVLGLGL